MANKSIGPTFDYGPFPTLTTARLRLRQVTPADTKAVFAFRGDYEVTRHNSGAAFTTLGQAARLIEAIRDDYSQRLSVRWGITLSGEGTVIGFCGYNYWDKKDNRASIGYELHRRYWRQGIMREALVAMIGFGFRAMALNRVEADTSVHNQPSQGLLLSLGFRQEGRQREQFYEAGEYHDLLLFGLLRREWEAAAPPL